VLKEARTLPGAVLPVFWGLGLPRAAHARNRRGLAIAAALRTELEEWT